MQIRPQQQGIYRQIADYGIDQVLAGIWRGGERIPSVRQLAAEVGVNPNTVMHAYDYLKDLDVIETRRGLGLFVTPAGYTAALALRREQFERQEVPRLRRYLEVLDLAPDELLNLLYPNRQPPTP